MLWLGDCVMGLREGLSNVCVAMFIWCFISIFPCFFFLYGVWKVPGRCVKLFGRCVMYLGGSVFVVKGAVLRFMRLCLLCFNGVWGDVWIATDSCVRLFGWCVKYLGDCVCYEARCLDA